MNEPVSTQTEYDFGLALQRIRDCMVQRTPGDTAAAFRIADEALAAWNRRSPEAKGVVKALEWKPKDGGWEARSALGVFLVRRDNHDDDEPEQWFAFLDGGLIATSSRAPGSREACQDFLNERILSSLRAPSIAGEPVAHALRTAFVAMRLASALPGVSKEYDFGPALAEAEAALTSSVSPPLPGEPCVSKEWFERRIASEGASDPTTGLPDPRDAKIADLERLAFAALPEWAQNELTTLRAARPQPAPEISGEMVEAAAKAIYALDPFYEAGEYVEHIPVSPGGNLSWEDACRRDAEFASVHFMLPVTKFARDAARAALSAASLRQREGWRPETSYEIDQHLGWLKMYIADMTPENWRDMRLRAERQLERLIALIDATPPTTPIDGGRE